MSRELTDKEEEMLQDAQAGIRCEGCGSICHEPDDAVKGSYPDIQTCINCDMEDGATDE